MNAEINLMTTLGQRLKESRLKAGLTQKQVAERVGMKQPSYQYLEKADSDNKKSSSHLVAIARALGVDPYWLATGEESSNIDDKVKKLLDGSPVVTTSLNNNDQNKIWIDLVNIRFSCGDGESIEFHFDEVIDQYEFKPSFFKKYGVKPENMKLALATGDSQEPYICTGDIFGIDLTDKDIKDGEFYAVYFEGEAMLKQIFKEEGGKLVLHSLNSKYKDKTVSDVNGANFRVIGRQFYRAG
ncbi:XRE family transcriptional regulator [Acinetobacter sp. ANC 4648]|uniref:XRE family transcriptional regulator n=1 Tax=Acinetobacter sp. ANC 4648 TaxID=1977875 RepID=UPI001D176049|nr:XRE family transcriptional regulator [Acinetobacter sp. ANC 4648]